MTRYLVFANRKGGCGKTTTAVNIAYALADKGRKVLLVDMDPQAHATIAAGISTVTIRSNIVQLLNGELNFGDVLIGTRIPNLFLIPSSRDLLAFEMSAASQEGKETLLAEKIFENTCAFDYLIFDPPPTVGILAVSALVAAKEVYIPMQMHFLAMEGLAEMMRLIYTVNAAWNPDLKLCAIIPTFLNSNTRLAKEMTREITKNFGKDKLFPGIRMNINLAEAPGYGQSIFEYAPKSTGAIDYKLLANKIDENM